MSITGKSSSRIVGGSSGGSATAVAAEFCSVALGNLKKIARCCKFYN